MTVRGLAPVAGPRAHTLILGSMPGRASLAAREYYGHPRNAFWEVVGTLGISRALPYRSRCARLKHLGFALWDVLAECEREGSLDQAIRAPRANDLAAFAREHPELQRIWLNGGAAHRYFQRLAHPLHGVRIRALPSTSPANTDSRKLVTWRRALRAAAQQAHGRPPEAVLAARFRAVAARRS